MPGLLEETKAAGGVAGGNLITEEQVQDLHRVDVSGRFYCVVKRVLDFALSALGLTALLIPLVLTALVVYIDDPGKVIFSQKRVGRNAKLFRLYKFRTMKMDTPKYMATSEVDDPDKYITRVGRVLRKLSLDEIPQLFNVLKGDMSLVGPRPLIPNEEEIHTMRDRFGVYSVRPGVTGLAQINGRDLVTPVEKVHWDVRYVEHFGFWIDVKILFATVPKIFGGEGVVEGYGSHGECQIVEKNCGGGCIRTQVMMIANDTTFIYNLRREILQGLINEGYTVKAVAQVLAFQAELETLGCEVIGLDTARHGTNPFADLVLLGKYFRILKEHKPDVVLTNNIKPNVYAGLACKMLGVKYITNVTGLGTPVEKLGLMQKLTTRLYKLGVSGADCVLFQNMENREFFEDRKMLNSKSKVRLLPGSGVNLEAHPVREYPSGQEIHFLFAARIMKEKGIDLFLAAARKYHSEKVIFDVCGMCDDEKYLQILNEAHEAGVVIYHGLQKDMNPFYEQCSCFLYPSYYPEGMSNVLLEAAASGRPAIAADRSGCRETVDNGVTGYIVPVNDEAAVLDAVEKFLSLTWEQRRQMGLAARAKVEKEFDRQFVVDAYTKEISKV